MTHISEFLGGQYLNAADLQGRSHVVTIESFSTDEEFERTKRDGSKYMKRLPVLKFINKKKRMVCTPRKIEALAFMFGPSLEDWVGKRITLRPGKTPFGAGMVDCVEVHPADQVKQVGNGNYTVKDHGHYQTLEHQRSAGFQQVGQALPPIDTKRPVPSDPVDDIGDTF